MRRPVPPPPSVSPTLARRLREDLIDAGYTVAGLRQVLGPMAHGALSRGHGVPAELATRSHPGAAATLLRLWVLGRPVEVERVDAAFSRVDTLELLEAGWIRQVKELVSGTVDCRPYGDSEHPWWVVSDLTSMATGQPLAPEHVVGVGGASTTLAAWVPPVASRHSLDLGTGSGVQALHVAGRSKDQVLTDVSGRAVEFAKLTAAVNAIDVDIRQGSGFVPVRGDEFDLVVCNPPFVITPRDLPGLDLGYRDAGAVGDDFLQHLITEVETHLSPGGIAVFLGNWEVRDGQEWTERIVEWLEPTGLDALVVQRGDQDPGQYAETWAHDAGLHPGQDTYEQCYRAWLQDFARRHVERVGFGIVVLQRPSEQRAVWRHLMDVRSSVDPWMGPHVLAQLRARTWLAMHSDDEVLSVPWAVADTVSQEQIGVPGAADPAQVRLRQADGFGHVADVGTVTAAVVGGCDGELSAQQILVAVASLLDLDPARCAPATVSALRELIAFGMLR